MRCTFLLLLALGVLTGERVARSQGEVYPHTSAQTRMEGRIQRVSPDLKTVEIDVVIATSPSGRRLQFSTAVPRRVVIHDSCFITSRYDPGLFYTPGDLRRGHVVQITAVEGPEADLYAGEIRLGGTLPKVRPAPLPVAPETVRLPPNSTTLARFEPEKGCYLGAFVMQDQHVDRSMAKWEKKIGKGHASYLRYVGYGNPFPKEWVQEVRTLGAVPNLALEPNGGLAAVRDDAYLRGFAKAAAASGGPVFLRFGSEMNGPWTAYSGNPELYRSKFRLVTRVMRQVAPNVAMVWTPYCTPLRPIRDYYPGDDAVDWVGVNIYSVHHHDGQPDRPADQEDPAELLQPIYDWYAKRKPIQISEYAATNYCLACNQSMPDFAVRKMKAFYTTLPKRFPRVKMIYWFSWDTVAQKAAENNYAVTGSPVLLRSYQDSTRSSYFLTRVLSRAEQAAAKADALLPGRRPNRPMP